ncbi:MAG TPA: hypothetical protein IAA57_11510 [Candidatus Pullilachnospira intestinigallinarum]|nr:hypothetical protein [Candidatus Pullilachnospira intestinigallinarum]
MIVVTGMLMVSVPEAVVLAGDDSRDTFVITEFKDLDSWKMEKTTWETGTAVSEMGFPASWTVKGYLETDDSKTLTEEVLDKLEWTGVIKEQETAEEDTEDPVLYTDQSGAGEYYFSMKLPEYVKTAEDVEVPGVLITIKAAEPKTEGPKTEEPKTEEPKTEAPKTEEPKTEEPNTEEPKTEEPKTEEPKTEELKTEAPKTEEPKTEEPKTEEPKTEEPKTEEPKTEEPKTEEPKTEEPKTEEPKTEEPKTEDPQTETPAAEDPKTENPGAQEPDEGKIVEFAIGDSKGEIDDSIDKITVRLSHGLTADGLIPEITLNGTNTVSPASGEKQDFTNPVEYTVYSEKGEVLRIYTVEVITDPHIWKEATCESPKTCTKCEATEGSALGHNWKAATCETPKTCTVCGKTEGEALGHSWKEATCEAPKTCTVCGKTEGPALGHNWKAATCESPKTCTVCGKTEGKALGHSWKAADCTHPKTCTVCGKTEGEALGHQWSDWILTRKPTTDAQGLEERICVPCQLKETRQVQRLNRIGEAKNNKVTGIKANGVYGVGEKITITAEGAWMDNKEPIKGDVRYLPTGWKVTSYNAFKEIPAQVTFTVKTEGSYSLQVYFQKQSFDGKTWVNEKDTDTRTINFTISRNKAIPVKTGDDTMIAGWAAAGMLALAAMIMGIRQRKRSSS